MPRIGMSWTLMLVTLFAVVNVIERHHFLLIPLALVMPLLTVFVHTLGHTGALQLVRGQASRSLLWALGDMTEMRIPMTPSRQFAVAAAGPLVSLVIWMTCDNLLRASASSWEGWKVFIETAPILPKASAFSMLDPQQSMVHYMLASAALLSCSLALWNLIPSMLFDGGRMWRAFLWPLLGLRRSVMGLALLPA